MQKKIFLYVVRNRSEKLYSPLEYIQFPFSIYIFPFISLNIHHMGKKMFRTFVADADDVALHLVSISAR
jgi:hypothetical protein